MATQGAVRKQTLIAGADLSGSQGKIIKIDTAAPEQAVLVGSLGARGDGVLMNKPTTGQPCEIDEDGYSKALCGAAIASGGLELTPDATSRLIAASSGQIVFAISRGVTANAGEWVPIKITGPYAKP